MITPRRTPEKKKPQSQLKYEKHLRAERLNCLPIHHFFSCFLKVLIRGLCLFSSNMWRFSH